MPDARIPKPLIEDARIIWRNFSGEERQYNAAGDRNFTIVLTPEQYDMLGQQGFNVKHKEPRQEGDDPLLTLQVTVGYKGRPPKVWMIGGTTDKRTALDEETVGSLDFVIFQKVDLILNPYAWNVNGNSGVKAYLDTIYATIEENALDVKYADIEEPPQDEPAF